ncbi:helix-turn-helix transcriptional regulator [Brevundimonas sp. BAL3]|uniref:helix-turn-helix transcriptional regulator n=1 Tax=Brevundimonas sp. BAL3 TaxID=391600 RepID=UPI000A062278|nr:AraC family transcriptional regulator [Brevundimonas sp. BAL3]
MQPSLRRALETEGGDATLGDAGPPSPAGLHLARRQRGSKAASLLTRSVLDAIRCVEDDRDRAWDVETLAAAVGVTRETLRKNFRAGLGVTVAGFIRSVRLDWANERLISGRETRSVADIAVAAGFRSSSTFSRAYFERFGINPSLARARAVRAMK